ncbi:AraC family transcriptional regulator [Staphylococcus sp. IVB6214]|uniref:helix-turn-helix domain-containing protein n=1 Tax=Staphylococcus sp. IVB6214 TaxID=2989766 RepID=UPI0021CF95CE|nr:AraC family transcriptional regulator [Staphylococcus sp. IVB6214]UXR82264.1 helix-turn-helix domain-containing protein [Staphylococcus sp. IVB6214]
MRGITIDLLTHHQSETYRLLDEVQLFVSLDGILEVQHNGRHTSCYDQLLIVNRLDIIQISHAQSLIKVCIPMHFFSKYIPAYRDGYFAQDALTSHERIITLLKQIIQQPIQKQHHILIYDILKLLCDEAFILTSPYFLPTMMCTHTFLEQVLVYIYDNLDRRLSLKNISEHFFVSPSYISILFTKYLDFSFKKYFDTLRLGLSLPTLIATDDTIQNIALHFGFSNYNHYSKIFNLYIGIRPADYRNQSDYPEAIVSIRPYDIEYFNHYLAFNNTSESTVNLTVNLSESNQQTYTSDRQLFLEITNCHIYEVLKQIISQTNPIFAQTTLTLLFQDFTNEALKFHNSADFDHFCHLLKKRHYHLVFCLNNMQQFESFDHLFLQPLIRMMTAQPTVLSPNDFTLSIAVSPHFFNVQEVKFIQQRIHKYLPNCQFALHLSYPVRPIHHKYFESFKEQSIQIDFYCMPFEAFISCETRSMEPYRTLLKDFDTPIVLTGLSAQALNHLYPSTSTDYPQQFLALLLQLPINILGVGISFVATKQQPIGYFNTYGHQLPYSYMYQIHQCFAGHLNTESDHYILHETEDAYLILLSGSNIFNLETEHAPKQSYHFNIMSSDTLAKQLVTTYTYDAQYSDVTNGIAIDIEDYYIPLPDIQHLHQTFQLQPHITVHDFYNKTLHVTLLHNEVKLIKIYKTKATKRQHLI